MEQSISVAVLDLYDGDPNEGMRCIEALVQDWARQKNLALRYQVFDVRQALETPDTSFDIYISSGGPGSPLDSNDTKWENAYFDWLESIEIWNSENEKPKHVFFICHSFQLACKYYHIGSVCKRNSTAFGVFPVHPTTVGISDPLFTGLHNPFYGVDSRDFQVIEPNDDLIEAMGASILAIEKDRPHVPYERAIMAMRFSPYFVGTQFHAEVDAAGMHLYLLQEDKKNIVTENHGAEKWQSMVDQVQDPEKIMLTYNTILPNFLNQALLNHTAH
jgi:GMP synthase-like glutamine amidotransferase